MFTLNLFPKVVYVEPPSVEIDLDSILSFCEEQEYDSMSSHGNLVSRNTSILNEGGLAQLKSYITHHLDVYTKEVMCYDAEFYFTQSWILRNKKGVHTYDHYHPNSFISGAFYVRNDFSIPLMFHNTVTPMIDPQKTRMNIENSGTWVAPTTAGTLVMFPSDVRHSTHPNPSDNDRVVISFNVFVNSKMGNAETLDLLDLSKLR